MNASLALASQLGGCDPVGAADDCASRTIEGAIPGLGDVTAAYSFLLDLGPPSCADSQTGKALAYPILLTVAGKGEIHVAVAAGAACVDTESVRVQTQAFTVTGGTGVYAGASGSGTLERTLGAATDTGRSGHETWTGTLVVPGLEFDLTPPTISGAANKVVRVARKAKKARVTFNVTARDDVDGPRPVTCKPRSGSRFKVGKTRVTCSAADTSGNEATATFTVTVKRRR